MSKHFDLVIIGPGPASLAAAIYTAHAGVSTLILDQSTAGGRVKSMHHVANYPGLMKPGSGDQLAPNMKKQAEKYGAKFDTNESTETNTPGVYAAGDIRDKKYRQIATAIGDGTVALLEVIRKL